jgi:hypothetical protein
MSPPRASYGPVPGDGSEPGWDNEKTDRTIRLERMERQAKRHTKSLWAVIAAVVTAVGGGALTLDQLGIFSAENGWAWVSKKQYAVDRAEDKAWREKVDAKLDRLIIEGSRRGRR